MVCGGERKPNREEAHHAMVVGKLSAVEGVCLWFGGSGKMKIVVGKGCATDGRGLLGGHRETFLVLLWPVG